MKTPTTPRVPLALFVILMMLVVLVTAALTSYFVRSHYLNNPVATYNTATSTPDAQYSEIHRWTHSSGIVLTEKVNPALIENEGSVKEKTTPGVKILTITQADGKEQTLFETELANPYIGTQSINEVKFSPDGTYATIFADGYEASIIETYNLKTAKQVGVVESAVPYWNTAGPQVAFLADNSPIAGPLATLFYAADGVVETATKVKVFNDRPDGGEQSFVKNVVFTGKDLEFDMQDFAECDAEGICHGEAEKFRFDMASGTLEAVGGYSF